MHVQQGNTQMDLVAGKLGYCGSFICVVLSWLGEYAAGIGVLIGVATLAINWYYVKKRDTRERKDD